MKRTLAALLAAALCAGMAGAALADTLLDNVHGTTLDGNGRPLDFDAMIFDGQGRIVQVLARKDKRPRRPVYRIDGHGRFVLPGMIDSHLHLMPLALALLGSAHSAALPPPRPEDRDVAFGKIQRLLAARGVTAVADMGTTLEDWQTYRRAGDDGTLYLRVMAYAGDVPSMSLIAGPRPTPWLYEDRLRLNGLYLGTGWVTGDEAGDTRLRNVMSRAAMDGFQLAVTGGDRARLPVVLGAIRELSATYRGDRRWRIERVEAARAEDFPASEAGNLVLTGYPGETSSATPDLIASGVHLAFGSGDGAAMPSPLAAMAIALGAADDRAPPVVGPVQEHPLSREQALAAMTAQGARAGFAEGRFGRLIPGERADFIVLDSDPLLATPAQWRSMRVLETWIGGRKIYDAVADATPVGAAAMVKAPGAETAPAAPAPSAPLPPASPVSR